MRREPFFFVPKCKFLAGNLQGKGITRREKIGKSDFPPSKNIHLTPLLMHPSLEGGCALVRDVTMTTLSGRLFQM